MSYSFISINLDLGIFYLDKKEKRKMADYKVLGASNKNLKAINTALSINGSSSKEGTVKADFHFKENNAEIELPSGICLLFSNNGELSGIPLTVPSGQTSVVGGFLFLGMNGDEIRRLDFVPLSGGVMRANEDTYENPITFMPVKRCQ